MEIVYNDIILKLRLNRLVIEAILQKITESMPKCFYNKSRIISLSSLKGFNKPGYI